MKGKIKIAYITKNMSINGISTVILNYCKNLDKNKFEITIFAGSPIDEKYIIECSKIGIEIKELPPKRGKNPLKYYKCLFEKIDKNKFDIVHIHGNSATITIELLISFLKGIKIRIIHCHNTTCDKKSIHKILKPILKKLYTYGFACSANAGKWMFDNKNYEVLPNGFKVDEFIFNENKRNEIRKKYKIEDKFVIGHVGRFNEQKNHQFILKIFELIASKEKNAVLLLVGTGPDYNKIQSMIDKSPYKNRIICYGETNKVSEVYDAMDVFFFPSKFEGLGIVLLEAQIKGLYCITSDVIPKEAKITEDFIMISLNENEEIWADKILQYNNRKCDRKKTYQKNIENIKKYDIVEDTKKLEEIYCGFFKK